eukprot:CAMPEP_0195047602 /NCGR_PEP_ID=MMETSP0347-20130606/38284_1 /TAXON_ID=2932 /ORGANISM="Alexandrium fundyense, Strain CCMP1719" /LENGTH=31 /DNA_ID= /DNA_START= /DNA_END= /DNA_ORIENTATION=
MSASTPCGSTSATCPGGASPDDAKHGVVGFA